MHPLLSKLRKQKPFVSLDITPDEIRLLQLRRIKKTLYVEKFAIESLPLDVIVMGKIKNKDILKSRLAHLVGVTQTENYSAAIALSGNSVISKNIKLAANLNDDETEADIVSNLDGYFPGINEALCFDFAALSHSNEVGAREVLLVSAREEQVSEYVDLVNQAGLVVKIVDVDFYALARAANFFLPAETAMQAVAVLSIDAKEARFIVICNEQIIFTQNSIVDSVCGASLMLLLKQTIQLYYLSNRQLTLSKLILSGDGVFLAGSACIIEEAFSLPVEIIDPFQRMKYSANVDKELLSNKSSKLLVSLGLALRGVK